MLDVCAPYILFTVCFPCASVSNGPREVVWGEANSLHLILPLSVISFSLCLYLVNGTNAVGVDVVLLLGN